MMSLLNHCHGEKTKDEIQRVLSRLQALDGCKLIRFCVLDNLIVVVARPALYQVKLQKGLGAQPRK